MRALVPEDLHRNGHARDEATLATFTRGLMVVGHSKFNSDVPTETFLRERGWDDGENRRIVMVLRAASEAATTTTVGWARELASVTSAFLSALVPLSAGADLLSRGLSLQMGRSATVNIPALDVPFMDLIKQGGLIPVLQGNSRIQAKLEPAKLGGIVPITSEMIYSSNGETLVRDALMRIAAPSLDRRLFDSNAAVPDLRPAGLLFGKTPLTPSSDADKIAAMITDLSVLAAAVAPYAGNGGIVFIAAAMQAVAVSIGLPRDFAYPLLASTSLTAGTVIAVATPAVVSSLGDMPLIDETKSADLHGEDGTVTATFQTDTKGIRLMWPIVWAMRDPGAIAHITGATWP
jgi:hypothetical protein